MKTNFKNSLLGAAIVMGTIAIANALSVVPASAEDRLAKMSGPSFH